jgi:hypothetical protein
MRLKVYLATIDMKIKDFAELVSCNDRYLSRIVHGHIKPGKRLAKDIEELTEGEVKLLDEPQKTMQTV